MISACKKALALFLHFCFPRTCAACGRDLPWQTKEFLCGDCLAQLALPGPLICRRCGVVLSAGGAHCRCCRGSKAKQYKCSIIRSAWIFNTSSRGLVHGLKYGGADYMAPSMGKQMALNFSRYPELAGAEVVVPVPLFASKLRARGYNQSERLARSFSGHTGLPLLNSVLVRTRNTPSQTKLNRAGRLANMAGAFTCVRPERVKGKVVLLVDDVATTGATLEGCAAALKAAGAKQVVAYTYAREN